MTRTYITKHPDELSANQVVIERPTFDECLKKVAFRGRPVPRGYKLSDINMMTNTNDAKRFVDALLDLDPHRASADRIPFGNYQGILLNSEASARQWARSIVERHFPDTERRVLDLVLSRIPAEKTQVVWLAGERFEDVLTHFAVPAEVENTPATTESSAGKKPSGKQKKPSEEQNESSQEQV